MVISEVGISTPPSTETAIDAPRMGPVARRINNARAEGAILAGRLDDPGLGLIRQHHEISAQLADDDATPDLEQQLRSVVSEGIRQHGIHLDRLSAMFGDQLRDQSAKSHA